MSLTAFAAHILETLSARGATVSRSDHGSQLHWLHLNAPGYRTLVVHGPDEEAVLRDTARYLAATAPVAGVPGPLAEEVGPSGRSWAGAWVHGFEPSE